MQLTSNPAKKATVALSLVGTALILCSAGGVLFLCLPHPSAPKAAPDFEPAPVTNAHQSAQAGQNRKIEFSAETNSTDYIPHPDELTQDAPKLEPGITIKPDLDYRDYLGR